MPSSFMLTAPYTHPTSLKNMSPLILVTLLWSRALEARLSLSDCNYLSLDQSHAHPPRVHCFCLC